jgi:hypothetical protein
VISTVAQAQALLRREGTITLTPVAGRRSLVEEIAGPVKGSWWGHEKGDAIFRIATALEDAPDVLVAKLAAGKVTFVHRALWPALWRVVGDEAWRARASAGLSAAARRLLERVSEGPVRLDRLAAEADAAEKKALTRARAELETRALVHTIQEHTESGRHATVLRPWKFDAAVRREAAALSMDDAVARLAALGIELA